MALERANTEMGLALSSEEMTYLAGKFGAEQRDPTDAELMMFAQANSEHCRHKIFNAQWIIDGEPQAMSLFDMIRSTHALNPGGVLSAYRDNAAVIEGGVVAHLQADPGTGLYSALVAPLHTLIKVETHNHPTAISPFAGAATGSGGELRDEGATGRGGDRRPGSLVLPSPTWRYRTGSSPGKYPPLPSAGPRALPAPCRSCWRDP